MPPSTGGYGDDAVELARIAGLVLDPWQEFILVNALNERDDKWAAFEVGLVVPRQNGKGALLEARELAGLFLLGERLIIHSAHQFDTSLEAFRRLLALIEDTSDLDEEVKRVSRAHGEEGIELRSGQRIRFRTRTKGGGRGFTGDCLILDEAMILPETSHGALLPTLSARPNPQVWYTGSAVDQEVHEHGVVLTRIRERGLKGGDDGLAFFEWSADSDLERVHEIATSEGAWAAANPGLGIRISTSHVVLEQRSMDPRTFAVERLGVGDWPDLAYVDANQITAEQWEACEAEEGSEPDGQVYLAFDVRPDRKSATIGAAGQRTDGFRHLRVLEHRPGTGWLVDRLVHLAEKLEASVFVDERSPAASLIVELENAGVKVERINGAQYAAACGAFFDAVAQAAVRHDGTPELAAAVRGAARRPLGDAWAWSRKSSGVDISPLVACTLALWGVGIWNYSEPMAAWG